VHSLVLSHAQGSSALNARGRLSRGCALIALTGDEPHDMFFFPTIIVMLIAVCFVPSEVLHG